MNKIWWVFGIALLPIFSFGQDTTFVIERVDVMTPKLRHQVIGSSTETYSIQNLQLLPSRNIAELLQQESGIFIKNYGSGSIATSSIRGGNAGHTLVLWNDLPIQSPMLGLLDLSMLPSNISENVTIQKGGGTAKWGSGAVGGVIALNNEADFKNKIFGTTKITAGSFGLFQQDVMVKMGTEKFQSHTKLSYQKADNDFTYLLTPTLERINENAQFRQQNLLQDFYFKPKSNQQIGTHFWYQKATRQVPALTTQTRSLAHQFDEAFRLMIDYKNVQKHSVYHAKVGYFKEFLNYFDDLILLESFSDFSTILADANAQFVLNNKHKILIGTTQTLTEAKADNYPENPKEYRAALFVTHDWRFKGWQTELTVRQEMVDGVFVPITPMFGLDKSLAKAIKIKGKVSRNYRLPTLNDRFWQPGGNPDLLPENGWSEEVGIYYNKQFRRKQAGLKASTTAFNRNMNNWIMWSRLDNQPFWSANNITKVWSRGLESKVEFIYRKSFFETLISLGHNWVRSTNQETIIQPNIPINQQLFYTPEHQVFGKLQLSFWELYMTYYHNYTSPTLGINEDLDAYHLGNLQFSICWELGDLRGDLLFNINNIWNTDYFIVERRPMAGRHFNFSVVIY
ncbi:MAG: TonB-dependent receptor plug domain-containing protein [Saprospiraceae bacterium]